MARASDKVDDLPVPIGAVVAGKYRVEKLLGSGGMGIVAVGRHVRLQQKVAIKMLRRSAASDGEIHARFLREALASSRLRSEHVARVIDAGETESGVPFMIMEYLQGQDLSAIVKSRGKLPPDEAIEYVLQACEALAEAHRMGIVHRDLKPANLFVTQRPDGTPLVKILDFGISKLGPATIQSESLTKSEIIMGSPHYMSPEQLRSPRDVDARSDIWAVGAVLYKLISGEVPFSGNTTPEVCAAVLMQDLRPIDQLCPELRAELVATITKCLQKEPAGRFATVADLAEALLPNATDEARSSISRIVRVVRSKDSMPSSIPPPPMAEIDNGTTERHVPLVSGNTGSRSIEVTFGTSTLMALRQRRTWPAVIGLIGVLAIAGGVAYFIHLRGVREREAATAAARAAARTAPPPETTRETVPPPSTVAAPSFAVPAASVSASARALPSSRPPMPAVRPGVVASKPAPTPSAAETTPPPAPTPQGDGFSEYGGRK
jgi:serine/threonine-protein kinase